MFLDLQGYGRGPEESAPPPRRISPQGEKIVIWLLCLNMLLLFLAPIGGGTVLVTLFELLRHLL